MDIVIGFALLLLGAACGGSFGLPSKYAPKDTPWEVLWGPFFFFVTILIPVTLGPVIVPNFFGVYGQVQFAELLPVLIFGFLWGLGSMTLGMSFSFIGLSLAYSLNYGAQIATGALVPMAIHESNRFFEPYGLMLLAGVAVCLAGVIASGRAAMMKEQDLAREKPASDAGNADGNSKNPKMVIGVVVAILSGVFCACYGVAASFTGPIGQAVKVEGTPSAFAGMTLILWGGAVSACGYCIVQLTRNKTWGRLAGPGIGLVLALALAMAVLHDAAILLFGLGADPKRVGVPIGYAAFMSFAILVGNFHGFRTGEWKGASPRSIKTIWTGIFILIVGVVMLATSKAMAPKPPTAQPTNVVQTQPR